MRQIVLDTETTGLEWRNGDRVIEIGCVELVNRKLTGRHYHVYLNPERDSDPGAIEVHGITNEFLADKPKFKDVVSEFEDFVRGGELIIHNATFDVGFLDNELTLLNRPRLGGICAGVIDTLKMAKELNPGKRATLDALCERFDVDNARRTLHGALLDAELLAEVYLSMTRGQESLIIGLDEVPTAAMNEEHAASLADRPPLKVLRASDDELASHAAVLADIAESTKGTCLWLPSAPPVAAD